MSRLADLASLIRSKNAGPFVLTIDIMFDDPDSFARVRESNVLTPETVASLFRIDLGSVRFYVCENALSFKTSFRRPVPSGDLGDSDLHGGQQYAALLDIVIPDYRPGVLGGDV